MAGAGFQAPGLLGDPAEPKFARGTLRPASVPAAAPDWGMRRELVSPGYTTRIDQLWQVGG